MSSKIPKISMKTTTKHEVDSDNKISRTSSSMKYRKSHSRNDMVNYFEVRIVYSEFYKTQHG